MAFRNRGTTAVEMYFDSDNHLHREDGPALIFADGRRLWYIHGIQINFDEWCWVLKKTDEEKTLLKLEYM